ncbi:MAG TPA: hypothetical protein PLJ78_10865 [Anaerolineae bacterium]|nr:hypothetical protein [Anaerolineae bacterium]HQK14428.1 hypothetical protein [Anaerolineae bacterium]
MRLIVNESQIKSRTRMGEIAPLIGLGLVVAMTVLLFWKPDLSWLTLIVVWIGFMFSLVGAYLGGRYVGPLAHHKKVPEALKGLENSFALLVYQTPAPFVLVDPGGLTVIFVRSQSGHITYQNGKWRHQEKLGWLKRFIGQEGLGRPDQMALLEMEDLQRFLRKRLPEGVEIPVRAVILFVHPDAVVEAEGSPVPAFRMPDLKRWLRKEGRRPNLPKEVLQQLYEALHIEAES